MLAPGAALAGSAGTSTDCIAKCELVASSLTYTAGAGEKNDVLLTRSAPQGGDVTYAIRDSAGVTAAAGCIQQDARTALCAISNESGEPTIALGDRNDRLSVAGADAVTDVAGGPGDDELSGGSGGDVLHGDAGDDLLRGADGDDSLLGGRRDDSLIGAAGDDHLSDGNGRDRFSGGAGDDRVVARDRSRRDRRLADIVSCGRGSDVAVVDASDRVAPDCERVRRRR